MKVNSVYEKRCMTMFGICLNMFETSKCKKFHRALPLNKCIKYILESGTERMKNLCFGLRGKEICKYIIFCLQSSTNSQFFTSSRGKQHFGRRTQNKKTQVDEMF